jgi:hypothetical protein
MAIGNNMKTKMFLRKSVFWLFVIIILLNGVTIEVKAQPKNIIFEYCLQKLMDTNNKNRNNYLLSLSQFYIKQRDFGKPLRIFEMFSAEGDYGRYSLLIELINNSERLTATEFNNIIELIDSMIDNTYYSPDFIHHLVLTYLKKNDRKNALSQLKKLKKMKVENESILFDLLLSLVSPLLMKGLNEEAEQLLRQYEYFAFGREGNFFDMIELLKEFYDLDRKEKFKKTLLKIEDQINNLDDYCEKAGLSIRLSQMLFKLEDFENADKHIKNAYLFCKKIGDKNTKIKCFVELLKSGESIFINDSLRNIPGLEKSLIQNIMLDKNKLKNKSWTDVFNREVIKFLVRKGKYAKAKEIAHKLDAENEKQSRNDVYFYKDYYYYYLGEKCLKSNEMKIGSKALNVAKRIQQHMMLKIELLLDIAESYDNDELNGQALEIVNLASQILIKDKWERDEALGKIVMFCIKAGYYKMALKIIGKVDYHRTKSALIFEVAQSNIRECNVHLAKQLIDRYEPDITFKAYIISKIAAKLMVDGKKNEAEEMFKKAIDLLMAAHSGSLEVILKDYFYAQKYGRLIGYNAWERLHVIE